MDILEAGVTGRKTADESRRAHNVPRPPRPLPPAIAYGIEDACIASGLGRSKLYQLIKDGVLPSRFVAGRVLILRRDLLRLLGSKKANERK
jgi:predicted DNA-binding transcriptional regulator AlpA